MLNWYMRNKRKISMAMIFTFTMVLMFAVTCSAEGETTGDGISVLEQAISFVWTQFTKMAELVTSKPILLLPVAIFAAGAAIGLVKRLIS